MKVTARLRYAVRTLCELEDSQDNPMSLTKIEKNHVLLESAPPEMKSTVRQRRNGTNCRR
jgi:hypothetical protein